jgi:hypothetical protein
MESRRLQFTSLRYFVTAKITIWDKRKPAVRKACWIVGDFSHLWGECSLKICNEQGYLVCLYSFLRSKRPFDNHWHENISPENVDICFYNHAKYEVVLHLISRLSSHFTVNILPVCYKEEPVSAAGKIIAVLCKNYATHTWFEYTPNPPCCKGLHFETALDLPDSDRNVLNFKCAFI